MVTKSCDLAKADMNVEYKVTGLDIDGSDVKDFLFSLGCYEGETITLISKFSGQFVVSINDARYSFDKDLAECILVEKN